MQQQEIRYQFRSEFPVDPNATLWYNAHTVKRAQERLMKSTFRIVVEHALEQAGVDLKQTNSVY